MHREWKQAVLMVMGVAALGGAACPAQSGAAGQAQASPAAPAPARAGDEPQFSIGLGGYEAINASTSGNGTEQTTTNSGGGMLELRFIGSPFAGFEFTYSYNPENQTLGPSSTCTYTCQPNTKTAFTASASVVGLDYVLSKRIGSLRPFAVGGLGFFITSPANSKYEVQTVVRPDIIAGGGVDWALLSHLGLRMQVRDNIYKAPDLTPFLNPTGQYTHTLQPMGGFYYSF
jgi:opacity protein-like surface antigen